MAPKKTAKKSLEKLAASRARSKQPLPSLPSFRDLDAPRLRLMLAISVLRLEIARMRAFKNETRVVPSAFESRTMLTSIATLTKLVDKLSSEIESGADPISELMKAHACVEADYVIIAEQAWTPPNGSAFSPVIETHKDPEHHVMSVVVDDINQPF